MRVYLLTLALWGSAASGSAQTIQHVELSAVTRGDRVSFEGGAHGRVAVAGAAVAVTFGRGLGVEAELTTASGSVKRSYEGAFESFAEPGSTREEILRLAVFARRDLEYLPGVGGAIAFAARSDSSRRVSVGLRAGPAFRRYRETSTMTLLQLPPGVDPQRATQNLRNERGSKTRGGLLLGIDVPIRLTSHLTVAPEFRYVWGGPARIGDNYDEVSLGARTTWAF